MTAKLVRFLGSVRLAVPLLLAIAAVAIAATFYESAVGSAAVQRVVYKSPWFGALMFLLAVNLAVSTLSRYPWRGPRKLGFALTHWGLIAIVAGSAAVIHLCVEGMLLVRTDSGPNNQVRVEGELLEVVAPDGSRQQTDLFVRPDGTVHPPQVGGLSLLGYAETATESIAFVPGGTVPNLAVRLRLESDRMAQGIERWVAESPTSAAQVDLGPAQLQVTRARDEGDLAALLAPPVPTATSGVLQLRAGDAETTLDVAQQLGQPRAVGDVTVELVEFYPDFRLDRGQPSSASTQLRNPAVQLCVSRGETRERWYVFAREFAPIRSGEAIALEAAFADPPQAAGNSFRVVAAPSGELFYVARSSRGIGSGPLAVGETVTPGWADFRITLVEHLTRARVERRTVPVMPVAGGTVPAEGPPALHVATPEGEDFWVPWGKPTVLPGAEGDYIAAFTPKLLQLPFYVQLDDFIVERNEGSESVAMWTSDVTLIDPHAGNAVDRQIWMNHPTWFEGWKLAQASWNPGDLSQSTLQLKREPWWVTGLTWSGSLLVVSGIACMFYGPALSKWWRRSLRSGVAAENAPAATAPERPDPTPALSGTNR